ncbi:hypothetical protein M3G15_08580 [Paenibacillus sp. p3-SID1389]|uniref:hypothetical protein n=1 Tax=Paenibacillus sp. p3-SID1389 TaxID=2916364 RepID=UPI0021A8ADB7|nr:hypothetical protein [Paenibacillus sp. p3-SID1389]MCT2195195.1 hypothetical protein [Paenibacillus sp. p3-SID1389]
MPRKPANKITAEQRADWRNLPLEHWNTRTIHAMIIDLNAEKFGVDKYVPLRGYGFEQGVIKRALTEYGAEDLRETIERAFAEYRPTAKYPQLTAGFLIAYMLPRIMPQVLAEQKRRAVAEEAVAGAMSADELAAWL